MRGMVDVWLCTSLFLLYVSDATQLSVVKDGYTNER